ncbi:Integral membrane protein [Desulfurella amilsii]|uniref:Integral membrane protein n=1 Tax=Desulfurella amilsii TaxID=1562698 RepID=A0A1X4XX45_9BACT|nr:DUF805 domain-containing protein [Desulfurella amilsii]OSS42109.1 Integral membrane protein [Desulfurella amilsii]
MYNMEEKNESVAQEEKNLYKSNNPLKFWWFVVKRSLDFKTRSPRKEFWMFYLGNIIVFVILLTLLTLVLHALKVAEYTELIAVYSTFVMIWRIVLLLPTLSLQTRRFHDVNKSGWLTVLFFACTFSLGFISSAFEHNYIKGENFTVLVLIALLCLAIDIWLFIVLGFVKGTNDSNKYGPRTL